MSKVKRIVELPKELYDAVKSGDVQNGSIASRMILNAIAESKPYEEPIIRDCGEENE